MTSESHDQKAPREHWRKGFGLRSVLALVVSVVVLGVGIGVARYMVKNPNTAPRRTPEKTARLVETIDAVVGSHRAEVWASGEAVPATAVDLRPEVSGRIVWVSPALVPGGRFHEGDEVVRVEARDFELALAQRESEVLQAESEIISARSALTSAERELAIEQGMQAVARREFELLGEEIPEDDRTLVLREPQLQAAEADVESARASIAAAEAALAAAESRLDQAEVDLERTTIRAPFNAVVMEKSADVGDVVGSTTVLAGLLGTDRVWVEVSVPLSELRWIVIGPEGGPEATITDEAAWGEGVTRTGRVVRVLPEIDAQSRMARVLVEVADPLGIGDASGGTPALLVGSYVRARMQGPVIEGVVRLPRSVVRDGDIVRVMNDRDELELRRVGVVFKEPDHVLVGEGLAEGERVVTTNLTTAVEGMALRVAGQAPRGTPSVDAGGDR